MIQTLSHVIGLSLLSKAYRKISGITNPPGPVMQRNQTPPIEGELASKARYRNISKCLSKSSWPFGTLKLLHGQSGPVRYI